MKRIILYFIVLCLSQSNIYGQTVQSAFDEFIKDTVFRFSSIGFLAKDLNANEVLATHNAAMSIAPASTLKLFSTATVLELLGGSHRFETKLAYSGKIDNNGVLNGNIYIIGGGDPVLGSENYDDYYNNPSFLEIWAKVVKRQGISYVNGSVVSDSRFFNIKNIPQTWSWEDIGNYYGAVPTGLMIYENYYKIFLKSPTAAGETTHIIKTEPGIPFLSFDNEVLSSNRNRDLAYIYGSPFETKRKITGTIPRNKSQFAIKGSMPDPPLIAATELTKTLKQFGIGVALTPKVISNPDDELPFINVIFKTYSPPLSEIIDRTNKKSVNLLAEACLLHSGVALDSCHDYSCSIKAVKDFWHKKGMNTQGFFIYDGCGLSRYNAISAEHFVFLLQYMKLESKNFNDFYESLPVAGKSGTMKYMCRGTAAANNARAKSGTIDNVKSYAGYLKTKSGRLLAFAIMVNNFDCSSRQISKKLAKLIAGMAESKE